MILQNTTYLVNQDLENIWIFWMKETFIPLIKDTGLTSLIRLYKLQKIEPDHDTTYALHVEFNNDEKSNIYNTKYKSQFDNLMIKRFGNGFTAFRTTLDEI